LKVLLNNDLVVRFSVPGSRFSENIHSQGQHSRSAGALAPIPGSKGVEVIPQLLISIFGDESILSPLSSASFPPERMFVSSASRAHDGPHVRGSELKLERQLDRAWTADLVERIEASVRTAGAEAGRQRLCRLAEQGAGVVVVGRAKVGVVEDVEELRPETEAYFLRDTKLPLKGEIELKRSEAAQDIASEIALLPGGRRAESCQVENLAAGILRAQQLKRHSGVHVGPVPEGGARGKRISPDYVNWRSRSSKNEAVHRPATQYVADRVV